MLSSRYYLRSNNSQNDLDLFYINFGDDYKSHNNINNNIKDNDSKFYSNSVSTNV
jgi:hypothetical protein